MDFISVRGARTHNLKNIDLDLPRDQLIVITGLSGSGKSSLAFDTIFAEGQRRYVESLSAYARQFLSSMEKPDVDHIQGLSPAIAIEQKSTSHNPRSTVGTITEIHDYLRLLFARTGVPRCPKHQLELNAQTLSQMAEQLQKLPDGSGWLLTAPVVDNRKGEHKKLLDDLRARGFVRVRIDGEVFELDSIKKLDNKRKHKIDIVVDRVKIRDDMRLRLVESLETALSLGGGLAAFVPMESDSELDEIVLSSRYACRLCGYSLSKLEPRMFSFNSPYGACQQCDGLGVSQFFDESRILTDDTLSLAGGALRGWDRRTPYYYHMLKSLADHYDFDLEKPFNKLPKKVRNLVLYGSGKEKIKFRFYNEQKRVRTKTAPFEGIIPNLERRYRETESNMVREQLGRLLSTRACPECTGSRLNEKARNVFVDGHTLQAISALPIEAALQCLHSLQLTGARHLIALPILKEVQQRLQFLVGVGLDYLSLNRSADTLSGGEAQRIRLASQIGAGLMGVMYVLDEPSIGLHQRDNTRLLKTLQDLRDLGNTVIMVEHDEEAIMTADYVVDIGPGAGLHGGEIMAAGVPTAIAKAPQSITGQYLCGKRQIALPKKRRALREDQMLSLYGACGNNLKSVDLHVPLGLITCVTGVSGSGKSTLINDTLYKFLSHSMNGANVTPAAFDSISGTDCIDKVINIDQSPIGRTPRSNPATYTGLFTPIRELFAGTQEARSRGYQSGRFSFNVKGGRCEACKGDGLLRVEMHFLPDVYVTCDTCAGKRYTRETLDIHYKNKNISDVLDMTVAEALEFFDAVPSLSQRLQTLVDVGLSYIKLGQSSTTLSGGEAQRIKLTRELTKRDTGRTLYVLDEPTTGLHFADVAQLLSVLVRLCDQGNTLIVIEHNLDVIKTADWIIDMGPEGGEGGGQIIAAGTPEQIAKDKRSYTGQYLARMLKKTKKLSASKR